MIRILLAVAALAAMALGQLWRLLRAGSGQGLSGGRRERAAGKAHIDVLASKALGPKNRIVLVAVGERQLLLSVADRGASVLAGWPEETDAEPARAPNARRTTSGAPEDEDEESAARNPLVAGLRSLKAQRERGFGTALARAATR